MLLRVFYGFFFLRFLWAVSGKLYMTACPWMAQAVPTAGKLGRMIYPPDQTSLDRQINHTSLQVVCRFHVSGNVPFPFRFLLFTDFSFEVFLSNLPPLPFTSIFAPFSGPHQAVIFVLGAKVTPGLDGKARSSLLFSEKISSPVGSIFPEKLS